MKLNSRIFTNSFSGINNRTYAPFWLLDKGDSFYGLSKPQYSHQTYYQLANNGAGAGNREGRWLHNNNIKISFIPPK